jgi:hypothetical protein
MSDVRTLRPGLLVSLKTSIGGGNVRYERRDVEDLHVDQDTGSLRSVWETARTVVDPDEHAAAVKVRGKVRSLVTGICTQSNFGLLCPNDREPELKAAVAEGRKLAWEFNKDAQHTQIATNVIYGRVAQDDYEAVQAISAELQQLVLTINDGVDQLDPKKIRDAAQKMRDTGQMLSTDVKLKVDEIVATARKTARKIAKAGEQAAAELDAAALEKLRAARTAFLDLEADEPNEGQADPDVVDDAQQLADEMRKRDARAVDFEARRARALAKAVERRIAERTIRVGIDRVTGRPVLEGLTAEEARIGADNLCLYLAEFGTRETQAMLEHAKSLADRTATTTTTDRTTRQLGR